MRSPHPNKTSRRDAQTEAALTRTISKLVGITISLETANQTTLSAAVEELRRLLEKRRETLRSLPRVQTLSAVVCGSLRLRGVRKPKVGESAPLKPPHNRRDRTISRVLAASTSLSRPQVGKSEKPESPCARSVANNIYDAPIPRIQCPRV